MMQHGNMNVKW